LFSIEKIFALTASSKCIADWAGNPVLRDIAAHPCGKNAHGWAVGMDETAKIVAPANQLEANS
jgi:hypothetical protein